MFGVLPANKRWWRWDWRWVWSLPWLRETSTPGIQRRPRSAQAVKCPRSAPWESSATVFAFISVLVLWTCSKTWEYIISSKRSYLESPISSYRTCRHRWGLVTLDWGSGCHVGSVDVFSSGEGETLPLYEVNLTAEVTVANMVSDPNPKYNKTDISHNLKKNCNISRRIRANKLSKTH